MSIHSSIVKDLMFKLAEGNDLILISNHIQLLIEL